ncbi:hypothetical protein [Pseudorhodoplanes sinuspersici]|uniref:hypothetical protein n=1 Tax=Pseudorhodoplanes sinuspersici TaxID=1235591 RepID=UPI000FF4435F|nr:hypothetical protein [Pseudorhodoplanes sinuspersici]RKE74078.1 hypothetical protein DFP91_1978 [Pseudorhodoplanes sinuspersici]
MNALKLILATAVLALFAVSAQAQTQGPGVRDYSYSNIYYPDRDPTTREALDTGTW